MAKDADGRSSRGRTTLALYRALGRALRPLLPLWLRARAGRGKEDAARLGERLGRASAARPHGPLVWVHAASVGELRAVMALVRRLRRLGLQVLLTTGTVTSARFAAAELPDGAVHQFNALDIVPAMRRFLDHWSPALAVFVESEAWPVALDELARRGVPALVVNARLSDRSFRRWSRHPAVARFVFRRFAFVAAQSELDAERFRALGSPRVAASGNLKADAGPPPAPEDVLAASRLAIGERPVWTAASIHPAEDALVADAALRLKAARPGALAIVVPRHPDRADAMRTLFEGRGLAVAQRSRGEETTPTTDVLLADTMGEIGLWCRLSTVVFMGKSLAPEAGAGGGQNPLEPAACGAAVLSGRAVENFREPFRQLLARGGVRFVDDAPMLADFVAHLWANDGARAAMAEGGLATVRHMTGALERTLTVMEPWLAPLRMQAMLERTRTVAEAHEAGLSPARLRAIHDAEATGGKVPATPKALGEGKAPSVRRAAAGE